MSAQLQWQNATIPSMLEDAVRKYGEREAISQTGTKISYAELFGMVCAFADLLLSLNVKRGDKVGIWLPNYHEWIVANLAIASIGAITVPINTRFRSIEAKYVLHASGISVLVTTDHFMTNHYLDMLEGIAPECKGVGDKPIASAALPALRHVLGVRTEDARTLPLSCVLGPPTTPSRELKARMAGTRAEDPVNMFWTSGTTGNPKGALCPHRVLENVWHYGRIMDYNAEDRCLAPLPFFYTTANYWVMLCALMHGACIVPLMEFTAEEALETIDREKITVTVGIPNTFIGYLRSPVFDKYSMKSLRRIWTGGATTPIELARSLVEKLGLEFLCQVYGMTETGGITMITPPAAPLEKAVASVGRPLPNFDLRLIDRQTGQEVGPGVDGELWVKTPYNLVSYYGMSAEESKNYFTDDGWYKTGDVMRRDEEDNYFFRGRIKDMIKVAGENVAAREVENAIFSHPAIVQVAVVGIPDPLRNEAIVAFVETRQETSEAELIAFCKERLAPFKVPKRFMFRSEWPITATGKIQKFLLVEELTK